MCFCWIILLWVFLEQNDEFYPLRQWINQLSAGLFSSAHVGRPHRPMLWYQIGEPDRTTGSGPAFCSVFHKRGRCCQSSLAVRCCTTGTQYITVTHPDPTHANYCDPPLSHGSHPQNALGDLGCNNPVIWDGFEVCPVWCFSINSTKVVLLSQLWGSLMFEQII